MFTNVTSQVTKDRKRLTVLLIMSRGVPWIKFQGGGVEWFGHSILLSLLPSRLSPPRLRTKRLSGGEDIHDSRIYMIVGLHNILSTTCRLGSMIVQNLKVVSCRLINYKGLICSILQAK